MVHCLLSHKADANVKSFIGQHTPLHTLGHVECDDNAESADIIDIIQALVSSNANVNAVTDSGNSVLHKFCSNEFFVKSIVHVKCLIDHQANIDALNGKGKTPLDIARQRHPKLAEVVAFTNLFTKNQTTQVFFLTYCVFI
jgi:ankyrin repeat protein